MLITLVIIGIVAALTIPNLMTKYKQHVFENQFKKSLYTISQIVARTRSDLGVSRLGEYCSEYNKNNGGYYNAPECTKKLHDNIKLIAKTNYASWNSNIPYTVYRYPNTLKTYNNKANFGVSDNSVASINYAIKLADGSYISFNVNNRVLFFSVDLNGAKQPNRVGYDIFIFSLNNQNDAVSGFLNRIPDNTIKDEDTINDTYPFLTGTPCNLESTRTSNGIGCAYFALRNKCPYDDTKTYWECLK